MDGFTWITGHAISGTMIAVAIALTALITVGALDWLIERVAFKQDEDWRREGNATHRWWR